MMNKLAVCAVFLCVLGLSHGQSTEAPPTEAPPAPTGVNCSAAVGNTTLDWGQLNGTWLESARKPFAGIPEGVNCVQLNLTIQAANATVNTTLSLDPTNLANQTSYNNTLIYDAKNPGQFQIAKSDGTNAGPLYKVLESDYSSYLFVCAYYNATPATPAGAFALFRESALNNNNTDLLNAIGQKYSDFNNLTTVIQGDKCNGASTTLPAFAVFAAVAMSLMRFFN